MTKIKKEILERLPLEYQTLISAKNIVGKPQVNIEVEVFKSNNVEPMHFHRPISKIVPYSEFTNED